MPKYFVTRRFGRLLNQGDKHFSCTYISEIKVGAQFQFTYHKREWDLTDDVEEFYKPFKNLTIFRTVSQKVYEVWENPENKN